MIIAIDGPAGSGKSSVAKALAASLGFQYLDTGAMYRAVAYRALAEGISLADEPALASIADNCPITFEHAGSDPLPSRVLIDCTDVTEAIRTPAVDDAVSPVARLPLVRHAMVAQQRHLAEGSNIVVEGRDIGTVVFPDAALKVYLTATPEERARRRAAQNVSRGLDAEHAGVLDALVRRDSADSTREHSPLATAADAVVVDTTGLSFDEVVGVVARMAKERGV